MSVKKKKINMKQKFQNFDHITIITKTPTSLSFMTIAIIYNISTFTVNALHQHSNMIYIHNVIISYLNVGAFDTMHVLVV